MSGCCASIRSWGDLFLSSGSLCLRLSGSRPVFGGYISPTRRASSSGSPPTTRGIAFGCGGTAKNPAHECSLRTYLFFGIGGSDASGAPRLRRTGRGRARNFARRTAAGNRGEDGRDAGGKGAAAHRRREQGGLFNHLLGGVVRGQDGGTARRQARYHAAQQVIKKSA